MTHTWPGSKMRPLYSNESKGLPLQKSALPSVFSMAASAVHSALCVGFESAKMMGCWLILAISASTSEVKALGCAETPTIAVTGGGRSANDQGEPRVRKIYAALKALVARECTREQR